METNEGTKYINDILLVSDLAENFLSVAQMIKNEYSLLFKDDRCTIKDPAKKKIVDVVVENKSFPLIQKYPSEKLNRANMQSTWLWHRRYGHVNVRALNYPHKKSMVRDLPSIHVS